MARLIVKVTPNAKRTEILGPVEIAGGETALAIKLKAPPVDGKANEALVAFLAETLHLPKSRITLVRGKSSRIKHLEFTGLTAEKLEALFYGEWH